jgi:hypothetical protein
MSALIATEKFTVKNITISSEGTIEKLETKVWTESRNYQ